MTRTAARRNFGHSAFSREAWKCQTRLMTIANCAWTNLDLRILDAIVTISAVFLGILTFSLMNGKCVIVSIHNWVGSDFSHTQMTLSMQVYTAAQFPLVFFLDKFTKRNQHAFACALIFSYFLLETGYRPGQFQTGIFIPMQNPTSLPIKHILLFCMSVSEWYHGSRGI